MALKIKTVTPFYEATVLGTSVAQFFSYFPYTVPANTIAKTDWRKIGTLNTLHTEYSLLETGIPPDVSNIERASIALSINNAIVSTAQTVAAGSASIAYRQYDIGGCFAVETITGNTCITPSFYLSVTEQTATIICAAPNPRRFERVRNKFICLNTQLSSNVNTSIKLTAPTQIADPAGGAFLTTNDVYQQFIRNNPQTTSAAAGFVQLSFITSTPQNLSYSPADTFRKGFDIIMQPNHKLGFELCVPPNMVTKQLRFGMTGSASSYLSYGGSVSSGSPFNLNTIYGSYFVIEETL